MVKVSRNQLFAIPERRDEWLRNLQSKQGDRFNNLINNDYYDLS